MRQGSINRLALSKQAPKRGFYGQKLNLIHHCQVLHPFGLPGKILCRLRMTEDYKAGAFVSAAVWIAFFHQIIGLAGM